MAHDQYSAASSSTSLQETQFASPSLVDSVLRNDQPSQDYNLLTNTNDYLLKTGTVTVDHVKPNTYPDDPDNILTPLVPESPSPSPPPQPLSQPTTSPRVIAPDLLRGFLMTLQAIDHAAVFSAAYSHGLATIGETASTRFTKWSEPVAYAARLSTHLCAPGFLFLLGMGVVYFGRSRAKLGWSTKRMVRHFFVRGVVLVAVNGVLGLIILQKVFPVINVVLLALGVDYFLAGLVWLAVDWTEPRVAELIGRVVPDSTERGSETRPLLHYTHLSTSTSMSNYRDPSPHQTRSSQLSFHAHNILLLVLSQLTIWWNIWLDPYHGRCPPSPTTTPAPTPFFTNPLSRFLFYFMKSQYLFSGFPPLAWLSPALIGLLYGRLVLSRRWNPRSINTANLLAGLSFLVLFVLTRLYRFGNLDTTCLAMPEHLAHPDKNQYLLSVRSFFNITKYPPAPSFLFFTMGCNFLLLSLFGVVPARAVKFFPFSVLLVFGTTALFFFVVHMPLYEALGGLLKQLFGHKLEWDEMGRPGRKAWGIGMGVLFWADWVVGLAVLWPLCRWYGRFKAGKGVDSIWRFF